MKTIVILAALGVLAAATHANVMHAGGYYSDGAPLAMTLSALLAVGIAYATTSWRDGSQALAALLGLCIVSGEVYWLVVNAERELAAREEMEAPSRAAKEARNAAKDRLKRAEDAKRKADSDAVEQAALPGCAKNCAAILKDAKDRAERELTTAREAVVALPPERSASPLSERLGIASWAWDLILAGLRSLAVVGASVALALALHPKREEVNYGKSPQLNEMPTNVVTLPPGSVARFLKETLRPAEGQRVNIADLVERYFFWCKKVGVQPVEKQTLVKEIARLFEKAGLETEVEKGTRYAVGTSMVA
jgi:hypothetical protein